MWLFNTAKGLIRKKDGDRPFARACSDRTRGYGITLRNGRFRLAIREKFFMMMVVGHGLPREVVDAPPLEVFKAQLDRTVRNSSSERYSCPWQAGLK